MRLLSIGCQGYKPFRKRVDLGLRPLTVLFGRNNSGKTALLRLPRLLLRSLSSRARIGFPLETDGLRFGESFRDLIHERLIHGRITFAVELEHSGHRLALEAEIQNIALSVAGADAEAQYQVVASWRSAEPSISLRWDTSRHRPPSYGQHGAIEFRGLLPAAAAETELPCRVFDEWSLAVRDFEDRISHLSAQRRSISGSYERGVPRPIGLDGASAPGQLAESSHLLGAVGEWYERNMDGWRLSLDSSGELFRCLLRRGTVEVNLSDSGDGMQMLLPVVTQQILHTLDNRDPFFDFIEEPELHLHPAAHAPLADLFLDTARTGRGQVLVETHSENLLLRIRRRVAEGAVDPDLVGLYWVEDQVDGSSSVRRIRIQPDGEVDDWPEGVFSESYHEVRALRHAARARSFSDTRG